MEKTLTQMAQLSYAGQYQQAFDLGLPYLKTHSDDVMLRFCMARLAVAVGEWSMGLELFDSVRGHKIFGGEYLTRKRPLWNGEPLLGKKILINVEGGLGDIICFSRFAIELERRGASVILAADAQMHFILKTMPCQATLIAASAVDAVEFDFWAPSLSLPRLLGLNPENISSESYLQCPTDSQIKWKTILKTPKKKVGLIWQGNPQFAEDQYRSFAAEVFEPLLDLSDMTFYTLKKSSLTATDVSEHIKGPTDLAGFLSQLDLLISVDTGPAHLAAAMGTPTILLNRLFGWFTFAYKSVPGELQTCHWYKSMKLLHQKKSLDWTSEILFLKKFLPTMSLNKTAPALSDIYHPDSPIASKELISAVKTRYGLMLTVPNDFYVGKALEVYGEYGQKECELFEKIIRPGDTVIDVGAHLGAHTACLAQLVGSTGKVYAFEPQPFLRKILAANMALLNLNWVQIFEMALADRADEVKVEALDYRRVGNFGAVEFSTPNGHDISIQRTTLDSFPFDRVDFIKMDIEGMELSALRGAELTIKKFSPKLWIEVDRAALRPAIENLLASWGYQWSEQFTFLFNGTNFNNVSGNIYANTMSFNILATKAGS